tara:strand:- start:13 stop:303 length:291 start_codon:yes stop_codon:yes gene_type:complete
MKRKIIRQVEIEYEVDIDIDKMRYKSSVTSTEWLKGEIKCFHHITFSKPSVPSIQEYCDRVSFVEPTYTSENKNLYVYSDIKAKIVRDITISNEEI